MKRSRLKSRGLQSPRALVKFQKSTRDFVDDIDLGKLLLHARRIAVRCARRDPHRFCTLDDVRSHLVRAGHSPTALGRHACSLFRVPGWMATCLRVRSRQRRCRGSELVVWKHLGHSAAGASRPPWRGFSVVVPDRVTLDATWNLILDLKGSASAGGGQ